MVKWNHSVSFHHSRFVYYGEMKSKASFHHSRNLLWWNDTLWFHFTIVDITYCYLASFLYYKDLIRKAFFTMATLLMQLLENGWFKFLCTFIAHSFKTLHSPIRKILGLNQWKCDLRFTYDFRHFLGSN